MSLIVTGATLATGAAITGGTIAAGAGLLSAGLGVAGAAGAFGGGPSASGAVQQNPYALANTSSSLNPQLSGNYTSGINNALFGQFDAGAFFNANPDAYAQYQQAIASGGLQGWTPQQFAQAYIGAPGNNPNVGSPTNGAGALNSYNSGGLIQQVAGLQPQLNAINQASNPGLTSLQNQLGAQAANGLPANQSLNSLTSSLTQPGANPFATNYQPGSYNANVFDPNGLMANTNFSAQQVQAQNGNPLLSQMAQQASGPAGTQLLGQENQIASSLLGSGGQLSPLELAQTNQAAIANYAARGLDATNASLVNQAQTTQAANYARLTQNLGLAGQVQGQNQAAINQQQNFGLGVGSQLAGYSALNLQGQQANQAANLQAQGLGLQAQTANQNFGLGSYQANTAAQAQAAQINNQAQQFQSQQQQQAAQLQAQYLAQAAGLSQSGTAQNLAAQQLGLQGQLATYSPITSGDLLGLGNTVAASNNSTINGIAGFNANSQASQQIAGQNAQAGLNSGLLSFGGQVLGASLGSQTGGYSSLFGLGAASGIGQPTSYNQFLQNNPQSYAAIGQQTCWVAREVYGATNPRWTVFRHWLLTRAPRWFLNLYVKHGARFAEWLKDKPTLKRVIRRWMDSRIATLT